MASRGIHRDGKYGGMRASSCGWETIFPISKPTPPQRSHGSVHHESGRHRPIVCGLSAEWRMVHSPNTTTDRKPDCESTSSQSVEQSVVKKYKTEFDKYGTADQGFNVICTTYRLTEHYHYWTKNNPMNGPASFLSRCRSAGGTRRPYGHSRGERIKVTSARQPLHREGYGLPGASVR